METSTERVWKNRTTYYRIITIEPSLPMSDHSYPKVRSLFFTVFVITLSNFLISKIRSYLNPIFLAAVRGQLRLILFETYLTGFFEGLANFWTKAS